MTQLAAEFWPGPNGDLFRIKRTPKNPSACVLFVPPLFEEMNRHRHVVTRAAVKANECGMISIVYDAIGTGDSQRCLMDVNLSMWQAELLAQIEQIQSTSISSLMNTQATEFVLPIILCLPGSAALMLTPSIIESVSALQFWQPELSGAKFVKQLRRLALAQTINLPKSELSHSSSQQISDNEYTEIAGYTMKTQLLNALEQQCVDNIFPVSDKEHARSINLTLIEFVDELGQTLSLARKNQRKALQQYHHVSEVLIQEQKYWQSTELIIPNNLITSFAQAIQQVNND